MKHRRFLKVIGGLVGLVVVAALSYLAYAYISYYRVPDNQALTVKSAPVDQKEIQTDHLYHAQTWNVGYGSYPPSYSFFMDGGKYAKAYSKSAVEKATSGVITTTKQADTDFMFFQEVDQDGDRSRHVDQVAAIEQAFGSTHHAVYGQNYDSPYLFYPFNDPIGKAKSGLITLANKKVTSARRYSLPIETNFNKFIDLDRAFTVTKLPTDNGHQLALINIHLSAFTKDHRIQEAQFAKLFKYAQRFYQDGNYVVIAGDYNHRLLKNAPDIFNTSDETMTWTHLFPYSKLPAGFHVPTMGLAKAAVPSVRALDQPYVPGQSFVTLVDGFILSPNVQAESVHVVNAGFKNSDHNPVRLAFKLKP